MGANTGPRRKDTHNRINSEAISMIRRRNGRFLVTDSSGQKVLGTHDTKKDDLAQLRAIEIAKQKSK